MLNEFQKMMLRTFQKFSLRRHTVYTRYFRSHGKSIYLEFHWRVALLRHMTTKSVNLQNGYGDLFKCMCLFKNI